MRMARVPGFSPCNWPAVRTALDAVGYNGWLAPDGGSLTPAEHRRRLGQSIAGCVQCSRATGSGLYFGFC
jgi:hypothetical protein